MSISSNPRLRTEVGRSKNWGWTKISKGVQNPHLGLGRPDFGSQPEGDGSVQLYGDAFSSAGAIWRSSLSRRA